MRTIQFHKWMLLTVLLLNEQELFMLLQILTHLPQGESVTNTIYQCLAAVAVLGIL